MEYKKLGDIVVNHDGKRVPLKASDRKKMENKTYPYYGASGIIDQVDDYLFDGEYLLVSEDGANLLARSSAIAFIASGKFWVNNHAHVLQAIPDYTTNEYLELFLNKISLKPYVTGSAQPKLNQKNLNGIKIPLPPLPQQKKIAAILDAADAYRQKTKALITKYEELTQSLFLEMFGDPVVNPMGWDKEKADLHIDLLTGYAFKSKEYSTNVNDIKLCGGLIIMPWGINWNKCNTWNPDNVEGLDKYWLKSGDIVMAMDRPWISSGFKICMLTKKDIPSLLVQRTARIRTEDMNNTFVYYLYKSKAFKRQAKPTETTVPHISPKDIRKYEFIVPPLALQNQFAERVKSIEAQKSQAQASLSKAEDLFNCLLQKAFKGELT